MTQAPADDPGGEATWIWDLDRENADTAEVAAPGNGAALTPVRPAAQPATPVPTPPAPPSAEQLPAHSPAPPGSLVVTQPGTPSQYELPAYLREPARVDATAGAPWVAVPARHEAADPAPAAVAQPAPTPSSPPPTEYPVAEYPVAEYPAPEYAPADYPDADFPTQAIYPSGPVADGSAGSAAAGSAAATTEPARWALGTGQVGGAASVPGLPPAPAAAAVPPVSPADQPPAAPAGEFGSPTYSASGVDVESPPPVPRPEALLLPEPRRDAAVPASWGWRGRLRALTGGLLRISAGPDEMADRQARRDIQRSFSRPMTVVVISPKGGAGKTPTTIGLAAALGTHRGGYVVGWDDNETRGTLAVRVTNPNGQQTTVWDLLGKLEMFERTDARVGDLGHYVRSQGDSHFDALVSDDSPANMAQIGDEEFHRIHAVLERFYRQIVIDTGNNVRSLNWQAAVNAADLVVVVSTYQRDVGYSGSWVLDHLTETGREQLANEAVTVLTAADANPDPAVRAELLAHFGARTQAVVEIPYDPMIALGGPIEWSKLKPGTQRAWTKAGAAIVSALATTDEKQRVATR